MGHTTATVLLRRAPQMSQIGVWGQHSSKVIVWLPPLQHLQPLKAPLTTRSWPVNSRRVVSLHSSLTAQTWQLCVTLSPRSLVHRYLQTAAGQPSCKPAGAPWDFDYVQQRKRKEFLLLTLDFVLTKGSLTSARLFNKQVLAVIKSSSKHLTMSSMFLHLGKSSQRWPGTIFRAIVLSAWMVSPVIAGRFVCACVCGCVFLAWHLISTLTLR